MNTRKAICLAVLLSIFITSTTYPCNITRLKIYQIIKSFLVKEKKVEKKKNTTLIVSIIGATLLIPALLFGFYRSFNDKGEPKLDNEDKPDEENQSLEKQLFKTIRDLENSSDEEDGDDSLIKKLITAYKKIRKKLKLLRLSNISKQKKLSGLENIKKEYEAVPKKFFKPNKAYFKKMSTQEKDELNKMFNLK